MDPKDSASVSRRIFLRLGCAVLPGTLFLKACDPDTPSSPSRGEPQPGSGDAPVAPSEAGVTVSGKIVWDGGIVSRKKLPYKPEELHGGATAVYDETLVVTDGYVRDVLVWVKGKGKKVSESPVEPVVLDQVAARFTPHSLALRPGQELIIRNTDDVQQAVHFLPKLNREVAYSQKAGPGVEDRHRFTVPETGIPVCCDVHVWESAWIHVMDVPAFAISDVAGAFRMERVPAGKQTLHFWHEKGKIDPVEVEVGADDAGPLEIKMS